MNDYCKEVLIKMYNDCLDQFGNKHDLSLLISMIPRNSNTIKRAFINASYEAESSNVMNVLRDGGYVKEVSPGQYILSARGLWYVEFELKPLGSEHYIEWIDKEYLQMDNEPISDKNRIILLSLFAVRCFNEKTCATYSDGSKEAAFLNSLYESEEFLIEMNLIKSGVLETNSSKSKSKISSILGQIDKLPSSTGMKFRAKDKHYYIDVLKNDGIDRQSITFITKIIMGNNSSLEQIERLEQFCDVQYMKYSYIFSSGKNPFGDTISNFIIKNGMEDSAN